MNKDRYLNSSVLLIGIHPLSTDLRRQFTELGAEVTEAACPTAEGRLPETEGTTPLEADALCLLSDAEETDQRYLQWLNLLATDTDGIHTGVRLRRHGQTRVPCHLLLHGQTVLWALQNFELPVEVQSILDVWPFTMEDQWAKMAFAALGSQRHCPPLDRTPITEHSRSHVHLVLLGWNSATEALAIHAALVAHYPNYVNDHRLRTRITLIDSQMETHGNRLRQRYHHLFDNSYYRCIDLLSNPSQTTFHAPRYSSTREEFVDIEWEFVCADSNHPLVRSKLALWARDEQQILTLVLCHDEAARNVDEAFGLPDEIYDHQVTILPYVRQRGILQLAAGDKRFTSIFPIGMQDCGYDVRLPLMDLARRLNYFYSCQFGQGAAPTSLPEDEVEREWQSIGSYVMRFSCLYSAMTMATKMRSLGHDEQDWNRFYAITQSETELLSAVEHNRWSVERLILGFRPPTDSEREEIRQNIRDILQAKSKGNPLPEDLKRSYKQRRIHYDLCSYSELDLDSSGQDVRIYDYALTACIPLIINSFTESPE